MKYDEFIRYYYPLQPEYIDVGTYISYLLKVYKTSHHLFSDSVFQIFSHSLDKDTIEYNNIMKTLNNEIPLVCPRLGKFIGYKIVYLGKRKRYYGIVTLEIPEDAKRSSALGRKCRCNKAKVLDIEKMDGSKLIPYRKYPGYSFHNNNFKYIIGETVEVDDFDECRWNECSPGIHFFMKKEEAMRYCIL